MRGRGTRALGLLLVGALGCAPLRVERRVEPGPVLSRQERTRVLPGEGGVELAVRAQWPELQLSFQSFRRCRVEEVERVAEVVTEERSAPEAGPALSTGIAATLAGALVLGLSSALSDAPDRSVLGAGGHFGPSPRQLARPWGVGLLAVGLPALGVGLVGVARAGESSSTRALEQVSAVREERCERTPASGTAALLGPSGTLLERPAPQGTLSLGAEELRALPFGAVELAGQPVVLAEGSAQVLEAFRACLELLPPGESPDVLAHEAARAPEGERSPRVRERMRARLAWAEACRQVPGAPVDAAVKRAEEALRSAGPP